MTAGDDLLSLAQVARILGCSVEWLESKRFQGPAEITLRDRSMRIRRRDLPRWSEMVAAEHVERRPAPEPTLEQRDAIVTMRHGSRRWGLPSRWQS